jgi:DNA polymerase-3 subunit epsilon
LNIFTTSNNDGEKSYFLGLNVLEEHHNHHTSISTCIESDETSKIRKKIIKWFYENYVDPRSFLVHVEQKYIYDTMHILMNNCSSKYDTGIIKEVAKELNKISFIWVSLSYANQIKQKNKHRLINHQTEISTRSRVNNHSFIAIDFETANQARDSACAIGIVKVVNYNIILKEYFLIKPPNNNFYFTYIHGIRWEDVKFEPSFKRLWDKVKYYFEEIDFVAAHNAGFDKSVLNACCETYGINIPKVPFNCTMKFARQLWGIHPTKLPDVCKYFDIYLDHHDALSDAVACAKIMIKTLNEKPTNINYLVVH